jgi:hypothetical protein
VHAENIRIVLSVKLRSTLIGIVYKLLLPKTIRCKLLAKKWRVIAHESTNSQREFAEPLSFSEKPEL